MTSRSITRMLVLASRLLFALLLSSAESLAQPPPGMEVRGIPAPPQPAGAIALSSTQGSTSMPPESWLDFGGQPVIRNVSVATLTPVLPGKGTGTGLAVIVAPGGAYKMLSMQREGWDVAHWLADHGIAAFVLKYRVDQTPTDPTAFRDDLVKTLVGAMQSDTTAVSALKPRAPAAADAVAAMRLVRSRAKEWGVDPRRVGLMGFSAGAMTVLDLVAADAPNTLPDFVVPIYPPMSAITVPADAPPMFAVIAADDPLFGGKGFALVDSWQRAKRPVEFHLYERGSHGFATGVPGTTTTHWLEEFGWWLEMRGLLPRQT